MYILLMILLSACRDHDNLCEYMIM